MLSKKMLEVNNFAEGKFQSVLSSFEPKQSFNQVTKSTFGTPKVFSRTGFSFNPRAALTASIEADGKRMGLGSPS